MVTERTWDKPAATSVRDESGLKGPIRDEHGMHPGNTSRDWWDEAEEPRPQRVTWGEKETLRIALEACGHQARPYVEPFWLQPEPRAGDGVAIVPRLEGLAALAWSAMGAGQGLALRFSLYFPGPKLAATIWQGRPSHNTTARRRNEAHRRGVASLDYIRGAALPSAQDVKDALNARDRKATEDVPPEPVPGPPEQGIEGSGVGGVRDRDEIAGTGLGASVKPRQIQLRLGGGEE